MRTMVPWDLIERFLYDEMERTVNDDPRVLLETDGGPVGHKADIILARLYERAGQVVQEMRLRRVEPEILIPLPVKPMLSVTEPVEAIVEMRTARFVLQSSFATYQITSEYAPPFVTPKPPDFMTSVLFVRYRRRV